MFLSIRFQKKIHQNILLFYGEPLEFTALVSFSHAFPLIQHGLGINKFV